MSVRGPYHLEGLEASPNPKAIQIRPVSIDNDDEEDGNSVLLTLNDRQAVKYNLAEQTVLQSWFSPSFLSMTAPIAFDRTLRVYATVLNGNRIIVWDGAETKLEKIASSSSAAAEKTESERKISDLLTSADDGRVYVVFADGHTQSLSYVRENVTGRGGGEISPLPPSSVLERSFLRSSENRIVITHQSRTVKRGAAANKIHFETFKLMLAEDVETDRTELVSIGKVELDCKDFVSGDVMQGNSLLIYVGRDGNMYRRDLLEPDSKAETVVCRLEGALKINSKLEVACLDEDYACVIGEAATSAGSSSLLLLVNVPFSAIIVTEALADDGDFCGLSAHKQRLLVKRRPAKGHTVAAAAVAVHEMILSDLPRSVGSMIGFNEMEETPPTPTKTTSQRAARKDGKNVSGVKVANEVTRTARLYQRLPALFSKRDVAGVEEVLSSKEDIPELLVLNIIEFLFLAPEDRFPCEAYRERLLSRAFNIPITEELMLQYLRRTDVAVAVKMLRFLNLSLKLENCEQSDGGKGGGGSKRLSRIIEWLSMVLKCHYGNLLVSSQRDSEATEAVCEVAATVDGFEQAASALDSIVSLVDLIVKKKIQEPSFANKTYCIEIVEL